MAEWWEDDAAFGEAVDTGDWHLQPAATGQRFPIDPSVTPEMIEELPEMTHSSRMMEGFETSGEADPSIMGFAATQSRKLGVEFSQAWLNMTTMDPHELGMQLQNRFPEVIDVRLAPHPKMLEDDWDEEDPPEYVPIARNKLTGYEAVINKPGISGQDVLQTIGLVGQFLPASKLTAIPKALMPRAATAMVTSGVTEHAAQLGQEAAGGEYDPEDVALATAFGLVPELLAKPALGLAMKGKELFGKVAELTHIPETVVSALKFATARGYRVMTSDALQEHLAPAQRIFLKVTDRIPFFGTAKQRLKQQAERTDTLKSIADDLGVDMDGELGQEIAQTFEERMKDWRFFGFNTLDGRPSEAMVKRAWLKEAGEVVDDVLANKIKAGKIDEQLVDAVFNGNNGRRIKELFDKLTPAGQKMAQQRFLAEGLRRANWRPGQATNIANPGTFVKYLDDHRKALNNMFPDPEQLAMVKGAREFIRITEDAANIGKGAGMTAAMAGGGMFYLLDVVGGAMAGMMTGMMGQAVQSAGVRNLFLRLAHAKGKPELVKEIMAQLRPLILATGNAVLQGDVDMPELSLTMEPGMVAGQAASGMSALRQIASGVTERINPIGWLGGTPGEESGGGAFGTGIGQGSLLVGPGLDPGSGGAEEAALKLQQMEQEQQP
jgi:hypothetical protein